MSKRLTNQAFDRDYDDILAMYLSLQEQAQDSPDAEESKRAYRENRDPNWR
jgi:enoyl-CoA hydratase/carnithine racemase